MGTSIVKPDPLERKVLLLITQEPGGSRVRGQDEHGWDSEKQSDYTRHEKDPLVGVQAGSFDLSETVRQEGSQNESKTIGRVPDAISSATYL